MQYQVQAKYQAITAFVTTTAESQEAAIAQAGAVALRAFRRKYPELTAVPESTEYTVTEIPQPDSVQIWRETTSVGPLQLRRALRAMGEMDAINAYMETASEEVKEAWKYATIIPRLDPLVVGLQSVMERTDEEVDQLFELALTFP